MNTVAIHEGQGSHGLPVPALTAFNSRSGDADGAQPGLSGFSWVFGEDE